MIPTVRSAPPDPPPTSSPRALLRYAAAWLVAGALVAWLLVVVLDGEETVEVPPVREVELVRAVRESGCRLERAGRAPLNPPVDGRADAPAASGVYDESPPPERLVGALRSGRIVIHYRPGLTAEAVETLEALQRAVPEGTLLVPNATRMPYEVAVTAYRRLLGCPRLTDATTDAIQLFRGRFLGSGP